jgi:acetolactate synthase-1/2/3 large subunit
MKITVSDFVAKFLYEQGLTHVFELTGGMITHLLDSLHRLGKIRLVSVHHEQAAAFGADVYGRLTGVPGVAMGTSGPGATNLLTGIASCYFDSSPAVFITGQVNRHEMKKDRPIRQLGFQETDVVSIAKPITKAAWQVQSPEEVPDLLKKAFALALAGRPGPVLIDIPMDVQYSEIEVSDEAFKIEKPAVTPDLTAELESVFEALANARRPLILAGGGIRAANAIEPLRNFAQKARIPVVNSLMAVEVMPYQDPLRVGMIGTYGNRWANVAISKSDVMLVLGSRLDIRQTGADTKSFKSERIIFHVDQEEGEINNRVPGCHSIVADVRDFLEQATTTTDQYSIGDYSSWVAEIADMRAEWPDTKELVDVKGINPNTFVHQLSAASRQAGAYTVDVGQHQMWVAQSVELEPEQRFLTSGGMGSMGFALPAAISAALVLAKPVVLVAGDGGFQCNIQELQTLVRNQLPIKMVVLNNGAHGMLRQFQQTYFEGRYQSSVWGYNAPDFTRVSAAYGIEGRTIGGSSEIPAALEWLWKDPTAPALLQVVIDTETNVYPKIAFGRPIHEMEPLYEPVAMEGT